jgi:adenosine deaminase
MGSEYLNEVMVRAQQRSALTKSELVGMSRNAFNAAWLPDADKAAYLAKLDAFARQWGVRI